MSWTSRNEPTLAALRSFGRFSIDDIGIRRKSAGPISTTPLRRKDADHGAEPINTLSSFGVRGHRPNNNKAAPRAFGKSFSSRS